MRQFFHGWRRKFGVVTLVLALLLLGMWIRSLIIQDTAVYMSAGKLRQLRSYNSKLVLQQTNNDDIRQRLFFREAVTYSGPSFYESFPGVHWHWMALGFGAGDVDSGLATVTTTYVQVPYWAFACPMSLLAAYLLLSKPRPARPLADSTST